MAAACSIYTKELQSVNRSEKLTHKALTLMNQFVNTCSTRAFLRENGQDTEQFLRVYHIYVSSLKYLAPCN